MYIDNNIYRFSVRFGPVSVHCGSVSVRFGSVSSPFRVRWVGVGSKRGGTGGKEYHYNWVGPWVLGESYLWIQFFRLQLEASFLQLSFFAYSYVWEFFCLQGGRFFTYSWIFS